MQNWWTEYPPDWKEISRHIRFDRAGGKCEQCGTAHCAPLPSGKGKVVLTTHHIGVPHPDGRPGDPRDKSDCRDENLIALCQRCHLNADRQLHLAKAQITRQRTARERAAARGWVQLELPYG